MTMSENICNSKPPNRLAGEHGFGDKTLLVTGVTGFLGKVFIEKVLRTCPLVKTIYVIIRAKKEKQPEKRLVELFSSPLFDLLKQTRGEEILNKVIAIDGDISENNLGLCNQNRAMLVNEVEIIYHIAATVRFDENLKKAVYLNTRGTKLLLDLAKECKKLLVFVHVSTVYSQWREKTLYEKCYPPPADPHHIIKAMESADEDTINKRAKEIMENYPNTYVFTKALAEGVVNDEMDKLPVIILRPSVVMPVCGEPLPGWVDNYSGSVGLIIAAGRGILRSVYCDPEVYMNYISVDGAATYLMLAAFDYMNNRVRRVYNLTTTSSQMITMKQVFDKLTKMLFTKMPLNWIFWYPNLQLTSFKLIHDIYIIMFNFLPAAILDSLRVVVERKPVLWSIQNKLKKHTDAMEFFWRNQWKYTNDAVSKAKEFLNETEQIIYSVDEKFFDSDDYLYNYAHGLRLFVLKETDETLPAAQKRMKIMWFIDRLCKILILLCIGYFVLSLTPSF